MIKSNSASHPARSSTRNSSGGATGRKPACSAPTGFPRAMRRMIFAAAAYILGTGNAARLQDYGAAAEIGQAHLLTV